MYTNKIYIHLNYQKEFPDYLKLIFDQHINPRFYINEDQGKNKKLLLY